MSANGTLEVKKSGGLDPEHLGYREGFVPSSFDAPHSSLQRAATWIGMGLILVSLAGFGTFVYGFGAASDTTSPMADDGTLIGIIGLVVAVVVACAGFFSVHVGRSNYRAYKQATGRMQ
ncbi:hypothetical protein [uncultured Corynebacterium sp.]|uniref:hypothetical protein n=1 Tax=uncultured Corynebacterium sp. TaxID=159447 RepID=UPI0025E4C9DA|nr:hypothetical protein [uncultured Corynebacterium sp.]